MINPKLLLNDLKKLVVKLEKDLRDRCEENEEVDASVRAEYEKARDGKRTAQTYKVWRDEWITQAAVAWVLGVVFVRFIEDNELIPAPFIAGPEPRLQFAKEQRMAFFQQNPKLSDREYLEYVFRTVAKLPTMTELYDERHNPLWKLGISGDGAKLILEQFQKIDPASGSLVHDFTDASWETRFLGDLYQDLSESARKKYALLQTPEFVEEFILDRTLDPAIAEFGLETVKIIDPTCGSGHFLLGAFARLFKLWEERESATNRTVLAQRALNAVHGVDLNPYAVAISRFRLLVAALKVSGVKRLAAAPEFKMNLAVGDSLLHGVRFSATAGVQARLDPGDDPLRHVYATEDRDVLHKILGQQYHAVVGNPPYPTVKDKTLNSAYRQRYGSCFRKYSLAAPFMERFFDLAFRSFQGSPAGYVGQITANSFMKREFGSKLVEKYIPRWDLTYVVDTSGAYIPGHGTPTVILFARNQSPVSARVRTVMGIRGEPSKPDDASQGVVWTAILTQIGVPGSVSEWVSVVDSAREMFEAHPWSIGGGGAAELKTTLDEAGDRTVGDIAESIGFGAILGEDDAFGRPPHHSVFKTLAQALHRPLIEGEFVRDWILDSRIEVLFPYTDQIEVSEQEDVLRWCWPLRTLLKARRDFGDRTFEQAGRSHVEYHQIPADKYLSPLSITFAFVATHNHFVLDRGGKVFNRSAPVIKLPVGTTTDTHLELIGLLNSSTACFWMKQVYFPKGGDQVGSEGARIRKTWWDERFEFDGTKLKQFPVPSRNPLDLAKRLDRMATDLFSQSPRKMVEGGYRGAEVENMRIAYEHLLSEMVSAQEELDWSCYEIYELCDGLDSVITAPPIRVGERAFEIVLARRMAAGEMETTWFQRHGSTPITEIPDHWPQSYRAVVERRVVAIETNPDIRLIEQPEYKRRWNTEPWKKQMEAALREWLSTRCEGVRHWTPAISSLTKLAASASADAEFMQMAELYRGTGDFDVTSLVSELVSADAVPALPINRYKESGLRNRRAWEEAWDMQRREDSGEQFSETPVPPKYKLSDFKSPVYWSLRGKLDVPKERFISFPGCERSSDPSLPILWAGYDHLEQAKAIAAYYQDLKENEAAPPAKLGKLLACILELLPWLKQWHNEVDPEFGLRMGDFYESFMHGEMAALGLTMDDLRRIRGL